MLGRKPLRTPPKAVLIVSPLRIGDALLATPLARSLKLAWPETAVDFLVLPGSQGVLEGNTDIRHVHVFPQRTHLLGKLSQIRTLWNRYDLALATQASDRSRLYAKAAAPITIGFVTSESGQALKKNLLDVPLPFDDLDTHTVSLNLQLLEPLGVPAFRTVVNPRPAAWSIHQIQDLEPAGTYAVLHPSPKFAYKMWTESAWVGLGQWLQAQGFQVVLTGSPDPEELAYVGKIARLLGSNSLCLAGQLSLAQTAELLDSARLYIGPDTAVTHMAAASGTPTIALFGPSNPVKWGPWPSTWAQSLSPWSRVGSGRQGNVWLLQGTGDCVPCFKEGCDRHIMSSSKCLQELPLSRVVQAASEALVFNKKA